MKKMPRSLFFSVLFLFTTCLFAHQPQDEQETFSFEGKDCGYGSDAKELFKSNNEGFDGKMPRNFPDEDESDCLILSNKDIDRHGDSRELFELRSQNEALQVLDESCQKSWYKNDIKININMTKTTVFLVAVCAGVYLAM